MAQINMNPVSGNFKTLPLYGHVQFFNGLGAGEAQSSPHGGGLHADNRASCSEQRFSMRKRMAFLNNHHPLSRKQSD
jgi:hypothetical protein